MDKKINEIAFWNMTANDVMRIGASMEDTQSLYKELWYENEICVLFAESNVGKSILAVQIGEHIAGNGKNVVYLDYELSIKQFYKRYSNEKTGEMYLFSDKLIHPDLRIEQICSEEEVEERFFRLVEIKAKEGVKIFILDNMTYLCKNIENGQYAMTFIKKLRGLKMQYGLSFLIIAHTPKRAVNKPIAKDDLAGSKKIMNFIDSCFAMGKSTHDRDIVYIKQIKVREGEFVYHEDNVLLCRREKVNNFLCFVECGYATESDLLDIKNKQRDKTEMKNLVYALYNQGYSFRKIAKEIGFISDKTVGKWIQQYMQTGNNNIGC